MEGQILESLPKGGVSGAWWVHESIMSRFQMPCGHFFRTFFEGLWGCFLPSFLDI